MSTVSEIKRSDDKRTGAVTGAGLAAGLVAILASSCCVLPIVFAGLGLGGVAALLIPTLAALRPYVLAGAVLAVVAAWVLYARRRPACATDAACATAGPSPRALVGLVLASAVVLLAVIWQPWIEPLLLAWLR